MKVVQYFVFLSINSINLIFVWSMDSFYLHSKY